MIDSLSPFPVPRRSGNAVCAIAGMAASAANVTIQVRFRITGPQTGSLRGAPDELGPAVEDRQDLVARLRKQHDDDAVDAHVAIARDLAGVLGRIEQSDRQGCRGPRG